MPKVLFVVGADSGQIHLTLSPAHYLVERGCEVGFYCAYDIREQLDRAGFHNFFWDKDERPKDTLNLKRGQLLSRQLKDRDWLKGFVQGELLDRVEAGIPALRDVVKKWKPDVMVVSPSLYEGVVVAETEKIPWVGFTASLAPFMPDVFKSELTEQISIFQRDRLEFFERFGLAPQFCLAECVSPTLNISFTTDELLGNRVNSAYKRVGASIPPGDRGDECEFPWDKISDSLPVVYYSMGKRTYYQLDALSTFFNAITDRPVQAVCMVGDIAVSNVLAAVPSNVVLCRYVPQLSFFPAVSLFVTSGGAASVMESLYFGVPMLVSPIWYDHVYQAHFVDKCGVGMKCDLTSDTAVETWKNIDVLLTTKRFREKAEKVSLSYKRNDGGIEAARLIGKLVGK